MAYAIQCGVYKCRLWCSNRCGARAIGIPSNFTIYNLVATFAVGVSLATSSLAIVTHCSTKHHCVHFRANVANRCVVQLFDDGVVTIISTHDFSKCKGRNIITDSAKVAHLFVGNFCHHAINLFVAGRGGSQTMVVQIVLTV
ncbi:MAG: DUF1540 domain-containing protein [Clostridia bacterium]|nr:DUF1540 domain-containing protein [Clostridia bacterium]